MDRKNCWWAIGTNQKISIKRKRQNEDSGDNEVPGMSKSSPTTPSRIDSNSNNELLRANPFLIPNVFARLCANSSLQALFKYRLVGSHIWNEIVVNQINNKHEGSVRLVKVVDPNYIYPSLLYWKCPNGPTGPGVVNVKELISTLTQGGLKKSTFSRIYFNSSVSPLDLNEFIQLSGHNIQALHYDRESFEDLRGILQTCADNLKSLSLWKSWEDTVGANEGPFENDCDSKFRRLRRLSIVSGELNTRMNGISTENNICNPSKAFLTKLFQATPNLTSLSARFYDSSILDSGLSFNKLTTLCLKFKIGIPQLRALCQVGLKLKKLRFQGLFVVFRLDDYRYLDDPEWMEFRRVLLDFIQTQANTLEYFAVSLYMELCFRRRNEHNSPHEQWSSKTGFPRMPHLRTFILYECAGQIPKEEFGYLFPKLRNLEIVRCRHRQVVGQPQPNMADYPLQIPISANPAIFVRNIRGITPTMELAQLFPSVTELHIEKEIPVELPMYWPKLKHLYYKDACGEDEESGVVAYIRQITEFLVGISSEESEWIEEQGQRPRFVLVELTKLKLARSRPSILDLNELETFEFGFKSYEFEAPLNSIGIESALEVLITLGLSRLTNLKKMNFVLEQKPKPSINFRLPRRSLHELSRTFWNRDDLNVTSNCDLSGIYRYTTNKPETRKWTLELNLDHHKSEWKEVDLLFQDDPDINELGLPCWSDEHLQDYRL